MDLSKATVERAMEMSDGRLVFNYSGRGMFGETGFGIVGSLSDFAHFLVCIAASDIKTANFLACNVETDSMGTETIYFFPYVNPT